MSTKTFPIMGSDLLPSVPWAILEPHERQAQRNHGQSLARLAERGGLSVGEAIAVIRGVRWGQVKECTENDRILINLVRQWREDRR